jgi:tetratricopeptide (TPR) repeat protein
MAELATLFRLVPTHFSGFGNGSEKIFNMHISTTVAPVFLLALTWLASTPAGADQRGDSWTANDSGAVAEAAIVVANGASKTSQASMLVELADALIRAGNAPKAKEAAARAASSLSQPSDLPADSMGSYARGRIVEKLALLGELPAARVLATIDATPSVKAVLLGKFGAGRAHAGSIDDARLAATAINSLSNASADAIPVDVSTKAIADISLALADAGALDEALQIAIPLPNEFSKVQALSQAVRLLCKKDNLGTGLSQRSQEILQQVANAARLVADSTNKPFEKANVAGMAGVAFADCEGAESAKSFITEMIGPDLRDRALATAVDRFTLRNEFTLARALLPIPDPSDAGNLLETAKRLMKLDDQAKATDVAIQAARAALKMAGDATLKRGSYYDYTAQLGQIIGTLNDLGAYDDAIVAAQPIDANNRLQYYVFTLRAAIRKSDATQVRRLLPIAIEAFKMDSTPNHMLQLKSLSDLAKALALAGYRDEALKTFAEFQAVIGKTQFTNQARQSTLLATVLQADAGDVQGALAAADAAGPMIEKPNDARIAALAVMNMGGLGRRPTTAEMEEALRQAAEALPLVAGPKAEALLSIATHMAAKGNVAAALQAAAVLEAESSSAITGAHDSALNAIADAQAKAGDLRSSFATVLRIRQSTVRWPLLLKLAGSPITH